MVEITLPVTVRAVVSACLAVAALTGAVATAQNAVPVPRADTVRTAPTGAVRLLPPPPDSTLPAVAAPVGVAADTAAGDTLRSSASPSGIDTIITYSASDSIIYDLSRKTMQLYGSSSLHYEQLGLTAERVDIDWNTSVLTARGAVDSADTTGGKPVGLPVLTDAGERYDGTTVAYNFKSRKGRINLGKTEIERGLYYGETIKRVDDDVLFVKQGRFTSCELEHPHYYFGSPEMKIQMNDKIVARPVYLVIADVPVFALPFGVFPTERGRRSGILAPAYGKSIRGRYITNLGYYWAVSDYMDLTLRGDTYTNGSYTMYSDYRYALRYEFNGAISASYGRVVGGEAGDPDYSETTVFNVRLNHAQEFNPTTRLAVDFTFTSDSYYQQTSNNLNDLLLQQVISNATLMKSWEGTPNSMTVNIQRVQNLRPQPGTVEIRDILPQISFSRSQSFPFRREGGAGGSLRWYELIGYSYQGQMLNTRTRTRTDDGSELAERRGIQHALSMNAAPKVGYISVAPFFTYNEKWYDRAIRRDFDPADSSVVETEERGFEAVRTFSMGISASTKLYGIVQPGVFGITAIRHQVLPSITYTYQPDFSAPRFGYYGTYADAAGRQVVYNRFEQEVFGGAPFGERQSLGFSVGNVFEMKTEGDSAGAQNKFQLLNLNLGISYNFAADSLRFSELGMDFRTNIGQLLSIGGSARYNLYQFRTDPVNPAIGRRVNRFLLSEEGRLGDLTGFSISVGTRLSGEQRSTTVGPILSQADSLARAERRGFVGLYDRETPDFSIPWNLDLTWSYNESRADPRFPFRSSSIAARLSFNLTEHWKITASLNYDLLNRLVVAPLITVYRDLHCWEMNFSWVPTGVYRNYTFEIRLKSPQLRDLKVTKQASTRGVF